jgi:hypothetical protein
MTKSAIFAALSMLLVSCTSPFSARESEAPSVTEGRFITPLEPQIVLINLEVSYEQKIPTNFMQCLDTTFRFSFDFLLFTGERDTAWSYAEELSLTEQLFTIYRAGSDTMDISLTLDGLPSQPDIREDTMAILYRSYELTTVKGIGRTKPDTTSFRGTARFEVVESSVNLWALRRWTDQHSSTSQPSWCDFKNGYR